MAAGRPVIAQVPARSEVALTVQEEACGIVVPTGDAQALATAIRYLHQDRAAANQMGVRAFGAYIAKYSLQPALEKYDSILRQSSEVAANLS
jgi:glycosyltransferase involved in cell wall biosynthesis